MPIDEAVMMRLHARAAEDYIGLLIDFVRRIADDKSNHLREPARRLVCLDRECYNRPVDWTPDGRGFCGQHAHVMDEETE